MQSQILMDSVFRTKILVSCTYWLIIIMFYHLNLIVSNITREFSPFFGIIIWKVKNKDYQSAGWWKQEIEI